MLLTRRVNRVKMGTPSFRVLSRISRVFQSRFQVDLPMPEMDGIKAFTEMRRVRPDVPVVLMSGYDEQDAISRFAGHGLAAFVRKPFTSPELRQAFRALAEARKTGAA